MNARRATRDSVESSRATSTGNAPRAAILVLLLSCSLATEEVRERRWIKEEQPLWREALALPQAALGVVTWPLKQALF